MPEVSYSIACYNNPVGAQELISDLYRLHNPDTFRIILVDQTKDGIIIDSGTPVHLHIRTYRNLGFSKAHNTALKLVTTPYVVLANDDVRLLHESWYDDAKACVNKDGVLAVNPFPATRTWDGGGSPQWYWELERDGQRDTRFDFIKDKKFEEYTSEDYARLKEILTGGNGPGSTMFFTLMKTETRYIVGLLDEAYWNGGEDYDYNRRIYLTCRNCNMRKHVHKEGHSSLVCDNFEPYQILTCTHSLVHHWCGVSKQNAVEAKEQSGYSFVSDNKEIWKQKWGTEETPDPDIYGKTGKSKPNGDWYTEVSL